MEGKGEQRFDWFSHHQVKRRRLEQKNGTKEIHATAAVQLVLITEPLPWLSRQMLRSGVIKNNLGNFL